MNDGGLIARWSVLLVTALVLQVGGGPAVPDLRGRGQLHAAGGRVRRRWSAAPIAAPSSGSSPACCYDLARGSAALGCRPWRSRWSARVVGALMIQVLQTRRLMSMAVVATASAAGDPALRGGRSVVR